MSYSPADGRGWKYSVLVKPWPMSAEPTASEREVVRAPSDWTSEPPACQGKATCPTAVIASG